MNGRAIFDDIKKNIEGELRFDTITKRAYSVDASIYEVEPLGIVIPKTKQDILNLLKIIDIYKVPIIPRGAGTGITGGCIGPGIVIDLSKYFNQILEININEEYAICLPGVIQDQLNNALSSWGYRLGPDTSTGNRATLGGMLANNAAGARSLRYGKMSDHILGVEIALSNGDVIWFEAVDELEKEWKYSMKNTEGHIYREVQRIKTTYAEDIRKHFPKIPRRVSGYNLDELVKPGPLNIAKLIAGSEGSLGIITKMKVKICSKPNITGLCVVHFRDMIDAMRSVPKMLNFHPLSLEMIDDKIISAGGKSPLMRGKLDWLIDQPTCVFVAEFEGFSKENVESQLHAFAEEMKKCSIGYAHPILLDPTKMSYVWEVRKAGLGLLLSKRSYSRAIAFVEDVTVGPDKLASFMEKFMALLKNVGKEAGVYGHVGAGCMHIRPFIDLRSNEDTQLMHKIMEDVAKLLLEHGGALSGEHGDGYIRSWLNQKMFGEKLYQAFCELKAAFDPFNLMNPGKVVHGLPLLHNLRIDPQTKLNKIDTFLDFSHEGGFELAVDLCNGNAACRKPEKVMCPSFQATGDEYDTTRARAQALRAVINGRLPIQDFTSKMIYDVLDLCLECKGCKTECPSQVDMAKMKSEFLYQYQEKHGYTWRSKLFGHIAESNRIASKFPKTFNALAKTWFAKAIFGWIGIAPQRRLPTLAKERFSFWYKKHNKTIGQGKSVVLFNDTYTEFNSPQIGKSAIRVLNALGYDVVVPDWHCCGRPLLSKGMLQEARKKAFKIVDILYGYAEQGYRIIGLEPSCILTIKDDLHDVLGKDSREAKRKMELIKKHSTTFDEFINEHIKDDGTLPLDFKHISQEAKLHGHCYQKSLVGTKPSINVLKAIPGLKVSEIDSGCCGMAGSFGYEKEHYELSMKIGSLKLFPAIEGSDKDVVIVADGTSCRTQIEHGTHRKSLHLAEILASMLSE